MDLGHELKDSAGPIPTAQWNRTAWVREQVTSFSRKISCCDCGSDVVAKVSFQKRCKGCAGLEAVRANRRYVKNWKKRVGADRASGRCSRCQTTIGKQGICENCSIYVLAWKKANRELVLNHKLNRLKAAGAGRLSAGLAKRLLELQRGQCPYCKADIRAGGYHLDHLVPLSAGGLNKDGNIQLLCKTCNLRKGSKLPGEFAQRLGFLL